LYKAVWFIVLNVTFNNISVISWRSEVSYIVAVIFIKYNNKMKTQITTQSEQFQNQILKL